MAILDHVSPSQIDMWQRCPRQWEYRYVKGLKIPPSGALIEGHCYHKTLETNFAQKITSFEDLPVSDCLDIFSTEWEKSLADEEEIIWEVSTPGQVKDEGISLVKKYVVNQSPFVQPIEVEEWYISEIAGVKFIMRIDLIESNGIVIDHKTSSKLYTQDDVDRDSQASAAAFSLNRAILFHNHVAVKTTVPKIQVVKTVRTREDIDWWLDMAAGVITQMKTGLAPPRPTGWHCSEKYCGYWNICRGGLIREYW